MNSLNFNAKETKKEFSDLIIVGSGLAGLSTAYYASQEKKARNKSIAIITKEFKSQASSFLAQGGIAVALNKKDSVKKHFKDTLKAGHYLNNENMVKILVKNIPLQIRELIDLGLKFDEGFGLEGTHSIARVMHIKGDKTGNELSKFMLKLCKENNVKIIKAEALELISEKNELKGLLVKEKNEDEIYYGNAVVLASGGYSGLWQYSTNPFAKGNVIVKALKAKAKLMDLEFEQFHPTTFKQEIKGKEINFLISEAVRGEGAIILNEKNKRILQGIKGRELAGRDIVARKIFEETLKGKVYLNCNNKEPSFWRERFPTIFNKLKEAGYIMGKDLIPITPAAHYSIGGIKINEKTKTSIKRLYAVGECSCSGLHGADRLASNSLSECLVFGKITGITALKEKKQKVNWNKIKRVKEKRKKQLKEETINSIAIESKKLLWFNTGIKRKEKSMLKALKGTIKNIKLLKNSRLNQKTANLLEEQLLMQKIITNALKRKNSLGVHYRIDYKNKPKELKHSMI